MKPVSFLLLQLSAKDIVQIVMELFQERGEGKDISENGSGGNTAWEKKTRLQLEREEKILFAGLSFF